MHDYGSAVRASGVPVGNRAPLQDSIPEAESEACWREGAVKEQAFAGAHLAEGVVRGEAAVLGGLGSAGVAGGVGGGGGAGDFGVQNP